MFITQMFIGSTMIIATVVFHVVALVYLANNLERHGPNIMIRHPQWRTILLLAFSVLFIIAIHTIEAWWWAGVFLLAGEFPDLVSALYFSVVTATTLGYGDVTLSEQWRLLGTFEAMGGLILFGTSTAFLIELMRSLFRPKQPIGGA